MAELLEARVPDIGSDTGVPVIELLVQVGDLVRSGQQVAKAGSTGRSTGAHVHFEVWANGSVVNPSKFLGQAAIPTRG